MGLPAHSGDDRALPPGIQFVGTERQPDATYYVYRARSRSSALEFLRARPVKEQLVYTIVETPEGNLGRDLICIFEEATGAMIELVARQASARPTVSKTHCAWCGYSIVPVKIAMPVPEIGISQVVSYFTREEYRDFVKRGHGFRCLECGLLQCAACTAGEEIGSNRLSCRADGQTRLSTVVALLAGPEQSR